MVQLPEAEAGSIFTAKTFRKDNKFLILAMSTHTNKHTKIFLITLQWLADLQSAWNMKVDKYHWCKLSCQTNSGTERKEVVQLSDGYLHKEGEIVDITRLPASQLYRPQKVNNICKPPELKTVFTNPQMLQTEVRLLWCDCRFSGCNRSHALEMCTSSKWQLQLNTPSSHSTLPFSSCKTLRSHLLL